MIETPFGNIHGIEDETITMLDLLNLFKAIDKGMIFKITYHEDTKQYKQKFFEVSKIVRCKDCQKRFANGCQFYMSMIETKDDFFCADRERKEGEKG